MSHLEQSEIDSASQTDLEEFLLSKGIRLKREGKQYLWENKNVWIKNNTWYSHYEQEGGYPITFVMKYFNKTFQEAVAELNGNRFSLPEFTTKRVEKEPPKLTLPPRNSSTYKMYMYLRNARGIDNEIIDFFIYNGTLYEDRYGAIHLHGHSHTTEEAIIEFDIADRLNAQGLQNEIYNVGCMYWNYEPVTLDEIIAGKNRYKAIAMTCDSDKTVL